MTSIHHSWRGKCAHIFRTDGRVVRATMGDLVLDNNAVYIGTTFFDDTGTERTKYMSPITIAALQVLWVNVDVVSDVDLPDSEDVHTVTDFTPPLECDRLPALNVYMKKTSEIECMLIQVNMFIALSSTSISPPITPPSTPINKTPERPRRRRRSTRHRKARDIVGACSGP